MNWLIKPAALLLLTVVLFVVPVFGQTNLHKFEFGISLGMLVYQGDLTPRKIGSFETQKFSLGLQASKILSPVLSVRAQLILGKLKGDDAIYDQPEFRQQRNFNFRSPVTELSGQMVWNLTGRNYQDKGFSPYVFAGAGLSLIRVRRDWSNINTEYFQSASSDIWTGLAADSTHSTPRVIPVIPLGAGVRYFFGQNWGLNAEATYRIVSTDYLDGFSEAANPAQKDKYMGYQIGLIYRTGKKNMLKCPKISY